MMSSPRPWRATCRTAPNGLSWSETKTSKPSWIVSMGGTPDQCTSWLPALAKLAFLTRDRMPARRLAPVACRQPPLDHLRVARHAEAENPEHEGGKDIAGHGGGGRKPLGVGAVELHDAK